MQLMLIFFFLMKQNSFKRHVLFSHTYITIGLKYSKSNLMKHAQYFLSNSSITHQNNQWNTRLLKYLIIPAIISIYTHTIFSDILHFQAGSVDFELVLVK